MLIQENDAAGGAGSFSRDLLGIALNGLSRAIDGTLAAKYPLTSFNETQTVNAANQIKPSSAPAVSGSASGALKGALQNPVVLAVGISLLVGTVVLVAVAIARK
jgi:ABC-type phosphate transport system permease subunit